MPAHNMTIDLLAAQLLVSRICHDLAGSISAVNAGVEILGEGNSSIDDEALSLIETSSRQSVRRLSFFRVAFGSGGGVGGSISLGELAELAGNFLANSKVSIRWQSEAYGADDARVPMAAGRVILGMVLLASDSLARGGVVKLGVHPGADDGSVGIAASAIGTGAMLDPALVAAMAPGADVSAMNARTINGHITAQMVRSLGGEFDAETVSGEEIRLAAIIP